MKVYSFLRSISLALLLTFGIKGNASDTLKVDLSVGADFVNHYVWRGLMMSNSPSIQPSMSVSFRGFSFGSWASYSTSPAEFQEVDLFLSYSIGSFTIGVNDYYNPTDSIGKKDHYFNYSKKSSLHTLEPFISISEIGGTHFSASASLFAFGNDRNENGKNMYSSYLELSYSTNLKDFGFDLFGGATLNKGYYADKPTVINLGTSLSKEIKISESFSIPCKGTFIVNPNTQKVYLVFLVSF
jgi:hypothetical protein